MKPPRTFREATKPFLVASSILGMGIFEYPRGRPRPFASCAYTLILLAIYGYVTKEAAPYVEIYYTTGVTPMRSVLFEGLFYGNALLGFAATITGLCKTKAVHQTISYVETREASMRRLGMKTDYRTFRAQQVYMYALFATTFVGLVTFDGYWALDNEMQFGHTMIVECSICYTIVLTQVVDIAFVSWIRYWQGKFRQLNDAMRALIASDVVPADYGKLGRSLESLPMFAALNARRARQHVETIRTVKQLHLALTKGAKMTNRTFGLHLLYSMTLSFMFVTGQLYYLYTILQTSAPTGETLREILNLVCWLLYNACKVFALCHVCARTSAEAANIGEIVCELHESSTNGECRTEIRDFTLQLIQNPLTFTACGFFVLDYTFVQGVIGTITTYLVILIQVGDASKTQSLGAPEDSVGNFTRRTDA